MSQDVLDVFRAHGTSAVSDALDLLDRGETGLPGLRRISGEGVVAGPVFTVRYETVAPGNPGPAGEFIDDVPPGAVVVVANDGRTDRTVWGDLLTLTAVRGQVAGTVIDGVCRDVAAIRESGYPLWSGGSYMKSGKHRVRLTAVQRSVRVCGVRIAPGDVLVGDDAGCLVVPAQVLDRTAEQVRRVAAAEQAIRADIAAGLPLGTARERHGYNALGLVRR
ncbi:RraA family protein [Streptantibioticus rubrisoli]|uniref:Putative 4-hydroxy-4-methyl-2-oxoglutarate aldolase n=1 Tax=Streptantibioticus rubrisoli TaxID=1387313 RepID=A0ABT1PIR9_9ACTN|nr:RraA family protein [Streptantibioticus rubrisoli]MCQ4045267.1 RraA family protein [Streptantibioticus rubrisoli]